MTYFTEKEDFEKLQLAHSERDLARSQRFLEAAKKKWRSRHDSSLVKEEVEKSADENADALDGSALESLLLSLERQSEARFPEFEREWSAHPDFPYLNRLKSELRKLVTTQISRVRPLASQLDNPLLDFGNLKNLFSSVDNFFTGMSGGVVSSVTSYSSDLQEYIYKLADDYLYRIDAVAKGNFEAEAQFLEGEIEGLRLRKERYQRGMMEVNSDVLKQCYQSGIDEVELRIANYQRDIREVRQLKTPLFFEKLGLPNDTIHASTADLKEIKEKQSLIDSINRKPKQTKQEREDALYAALETLKSRRERLIKIETGGKAPEAWSDTEQRNVKRWENTIDAEEERIREELTRIWQST